MMKPVAFRYKPFFRWFTLLFFILYLFFLFWFTDNFSFLSADRLSWLNILATGNFILLVALLGYLSIFNWKYQVILGNTHVAIKSIWVPFKPKTSFAYNEIRVVKRGEFRGVINIYLNTGNLYQFRSSVFEGKKERLLDELMQRLKPEQIDPGLKNNFWGYKFIDRFMLGMYILMPVMLLPLLFFSPGWTPFEMIWWKSPNNFGVFHYVITYSLDIDGAIWVITRDVLNGKNYTVWNITENDPKHWEYVHFSSKISDLPLQVAPDGKGYPWIVFKELAYHMENNQWVEYPIQLEPGHTFSYFEGIGVGSNLWEFTYDDSHHYDGIFHWDLKSNKTTIIELPVEFRANSTLEIGITSNGELLLTRISEQVPNSIDIYQLEGSTWKLMGSYTPSSKYELVNEYLVDITIDAKGQMWLLSPPENNEAQLVSRFNNQTQSWEGTELPSTGENDSEPVYTGMVVDARNRIWLEGFSDGGEAFVTVMQPDGEGTATEIVRYTNANSNLEFSLGQLQQGSDGKIWASDDTLWMDSNLEILPQPLPNWITIKFLRFSIPLFLMSIFTITYFIFIFIWLYERSKIRKRAFSQTISIT